MRLSDEERDLARDLIGFRNTDVHGSGMPLRLFMDIATAHADTEIFGFSGTGLKAANVGEIWDRLPQVARERPPGLVMDLRYEFVGDGPPIDVLRVCRGFVDLSARLVADYRQF